MTLQRFDVQGNSASYVLSTTLHGRADAVDPGADDVRYFCSLNGSPFERCRTSGQVPSGRLRMGLNTFQAQAQIGGREATTPLYHEFTVGLDASQPVMQPR